MASVISAGKIDLTSFRRKTRRFKERAEQELMAALTSIGFRIQEEAITSITQDPKTGRTYKRRSVTHTASAPGEAPASDTGRLVGSFAVKPNRAKKSVTIKAGGGNVKYAHALEFGTNKMAERPFMRPAVKKAKAFAQKRIEDAANRAIKNAGQ
jgi:HK97 gp10 family phage protein